MRCHCKECDGSGKVECDDCDGRGYTETAGFEALPLFPAMKHCDELTELQADAIRVKQQAKQLSELNPTRAHTYADQLRATLGTIEKQFEKLLNA